LVRARAASASLNHPRPEANAGEQSPSPVSSAPVQQPSVPPESSPVSRPAPVETQAPTVAQTAPAPQPPPAAPAPARRPGSAPPSASTATPPRSTPPASATSRGRVHTVAKGEGLLQIARKYYGQNAPMQKADEIYAANRDVMKSKNDLRPGMQLKIP
jgi:nucleoid-associated protein YgaU